MRWTLFQRVMQKLVEIRELDPRRDATTYAEQLLARCPALFAELGGAKTLPAQLAARAIAEDHLREICGLAEHVEALQDRTGHPSNEYLVRLLALAYFSSDHNVVADDAPAGYGMVDDCMTVIAVERLDAAGRLPCTDETMHRVRYMSLALSEDTRPKVERILQRAAGFARACAEASEQSLERVTLELIEGPPERFPLPNGIPLAPIDSDTLHRLSLPRARLLEAEAGALTIAFDDGITLRRSPTGELSERAQA